MHTPQFIQQMTDAEYKAWVEKGKFPKRLREVAEQERREAQQKQKEASLA